MECLKEWFSCSCNVVTYISLRCITSDFKTKFVYQNMLVAGKVMKMFGGENRSIYAHLNEP